MISRAEQPLAWLLVKIGEHMELLLAVYLVLSPALHMDGPEMSTNKSNGLMFLFNTKINGIRFFLQLLGGQTVLYGLIIGTLVNGGLIDGFLMDKMCYLAQVNADIHLFY